MKTQEDIETWLNEYLEGSDVFPVEVTIRPGKHIVILADTDLGISIDQCADIHLNLIEYLGEEAGEYDIEVGSPGLGSVLKVRRQYQKCIGKQVATVLTDGTKHKGLLRDVNDQGITLEVKKKENIAGTRKKQEVSGQESIQWESIKTTKEVPDFSGKL